MRPWFQQQFSDKALTLAELKVVKQADPKGIVAITGATITSEATTQAVRNAVQAIIDTTAKTYAP